MEFTPRQLLSILNQLPDAGRYWVGYSGGLDSHVLLHAMAALRAALAPREMLAIHVDHGLSPHARTWAGHCQAVCRELGMPCEVVAVDARPQNGEGPEAAARRARYAAISDAMMAGDCLVTAHHQDDQAETVLLQLLRGAGPHGLAGMAPHAPFGPGWHTRPLLAFTRQSLHRYAAAHGLSWIEDESNADVNLERNYLRHEILPRLQRRWPAAARTLDRAAGHCREAASMLDAAAAADLSRVNGADAQSLSIEGLTAMGPARMRNALRFWLRQRGLTVPGTEHMRQIEAQMFAAPPDRAPRVCWPGVEMRRYRDRLYAFYPASGCVADTAHAWDITQSMTLPAGGGMLSAREQAGAGVRAELCYSDTVAVRFRKGGERCQPVGSAHSRTLKNLFQEQGIPPWVRERTPLVYIAGRLAAVADLWICQPFAARPGERGIVFHWQRPGDGF